VNPQLEVLSRIGFDVEAKNHAEAILTADFPEALETLVSVLNAVQLPADDLIRGGGGEARSTQRLRVALANAGWPKHNFIVQRIVDGREQEAKSHEIDHVHRSANGTLALEIEWNNKDPFFDRDLENFQRLHVDSAISVGIIVTRGQSLQSEMLRIIHQAAELRGLTDASALEAFGLEPTRRQRDAVVRRIAVSGKPFTLAWAELFVMDKFGTATTHWTKLMDRVRRGVGNPCPLLLVGLPASIVRL
jgi:hypothetical protein